MMTRLVAFLACCLLFGAVACDEGVIDESLTDLEIGECVLDPGNRDVLELERVPCSRFGSLKVVSKFNVSGYDDFPGTFVLEGIAADDCPLSSTVWLGPTRESWEGADDRLVICFE